MAKPDLPDVMKKLFELLDPLEADDRDKVVKSAFALLGQPVKVGVAGSSVAPEVDPAPESGLSIGTKAARWMKQNGISSDQLSDVFHSGDDGVEVIAASVPGSSKAMQTQNCYLLVGIANFLAGDSPTFGDSEAVDLCKHMRCHDTNNHAGHRKSMNLSGTKAKGWTLTAPCLRSAAELVKEMNQQ